MERYMGVLARVRGFGPPFIVVVRPRQIQVRLFQGPTIVLVLVVLGAWKCGSLHRAILVNGEVDFMHRLRICGEVDRVQLLRVYLPRPLDTVHDGSQRAQR